MGTRRVTEQDVKVSKMTAEEKLAYFAKAKRATARTFQTMRDGRLVTTFVATLDGAIVPSFDGDNFFSERSQAVAYGKQYRQKCFIELSKKNPQLCLNFEEEKAEEVAIEQQKGDGSEGNRDVLIEISRTLERIEQVMIKAWG